MVPRLVAMFNISFVVQGFYPPHPLSQDVFAGTYRAVAGHDSDARVCDCNDTMNSEHVGAVEYPIKSHKQCASWRDERLNESESDEDDVVSGDKDGGGPLKKMRPDQSVLPHACKRSGNAEDDVGIIQPLKAVTQVTDEDITNDSISDTILPSSENDVVRKRHMQKMKSRNEVHNRNNSGPTASYMGVCRLPVKRGSQGTRSERRHRRIDIKTYPRSYVPFAMLYFTGKLTISCHDD